MNQIHSPAIPFNGPIPGGIYPGRVVRIQGNIPGHSQKFAVNLLCGASGDIALHLSVDLHKNHIVRNFVQHMSWGHEEKHGQMPVRPGQNFDLIILCEQHQYKIAFNGVHFTEFNHRLPFNSVTNLAIDGQVAITSIYFEGGASVPHGGVGGFVPAAPSVPFQPSGGAFAPPPYQPPGAVYPPSSGSAYPPAAAPYAPAGSVYPGAAAPYPHGAGAVPYPGAAVGAPYPGQPSPYAAAGAGYPHAPHSSPYPTQPGYPPGHYSKDQHTSYPHSPTNHKKSLLDKAGMAVAGALGASALMGGSKYNKLAPLVGGGMGGTVAGAALGGHLLNPKKAMKKDAKMRKKALKYGLPIAGAGIAAYGLHKISGHHGHHGHHRHRSSSSSSSSSSD